MATTASGLMNGDANDVGSRSKWAVLTGIALTVSGIVGGGVGGMFSYLQNQEARELVTELRRDEEEEHQDLVKAFVAEDTALAESVRELRRESQDARAALDINLRRDMARMEAVMERLETALAGKVNEETRKAMLAGLERDIQRLENRVDRLEEVFGRGGDPR